MNLNARCDELMAVSEVAAAVGRYVRANPQACDTAAGIAAWWLQPLFAKSSPHLVGAALTALVAGGEMECASGSDGQTVYRAVQRPAGREGLQAEPPSGS